MASMNTRLNIKKLDGNIIQKHGSSKQVGLKQLGFKQVGFKQLGHKQVGFKQLGPSVETGVHGVQVDKRVWFEVELQGAQGNRKAEVFQVSNDDVAVAQRWLKDKQLESKTNTDYLVKEQEKIHLGIKVGENITVTGVPGQEGAESNVAEKKKVEESMKANLRILLKYKAWLTRRSPVLEYEDWTGAVADINEDGFCVLSKVYATFIIFKNLKSCRPGDLRRNLLEIVEKRVAKPLKNMKRIAADVINQIMVEFPDQALLEGTVVPELCMVVRIRTFMELGMPPFFQGTEALSIVMKDVRIPLPNGKILEVQGERLEKDLRSLACIKADEKKLDDIRVVRDFPEVFPDGYVGLPLVQEDSISH
ncbi:hypothetical protein Tco_1493476 [Tanacetum coccineum]